MDRLAQFLDILAWLALVGFGCWSALTLIGEVTYTEKQRLLDALHGRRPARYPWIRRALPAIVAAAWLVTG